MGKLICDNISEIIADITADYEKGRPIDKQDIFGQPDRYAVRAIIDKLNRIVYAGYYVDRTFRIYNINTTIAAMTEDVAYNLNRQIALALHFDENLRDKSEEEIRLIAEDYTVSFMKKIPEIREYLDTDIEALYVGDPAAESKDAIIISYPGLFAITVQRYAHVLYQLGVPMLPRVMTEHAHSKTGIDINPGATIGKYFFIDHGTGVVVGETTVIGENVKIYQGVTLGALSTRGGRGLIDKKRHPTIEDNVTIYSGASILGGDTVIGEGSVIGGNVFLTKSVPPGTKVHVANQELKFDGKQMREVEEANEWFYII
ncbi:MAG: serine O-acetyltransferase [Eubacterium sp.]|nr:serine O-acetyltransferase [Eubacterium sp.]